MTFDHPAQVSCYRHPGRVTRLACSSCERPICVDCSHDASVGQKCRACIGQGRGAVQRASARVGLPPVTTALLVVTCSVYVLTWLFPGLERELLIELAMWNLGVSAGEWWRMVTAVALHGSVFHILFNMWALYAFGPQLERESGSVPFLAMYLSSAAVGSLFVYWFSDPFTVSIGASGAIFGVFGVWLAGAYRMRHTHYGRRLLSQLGLLLAINFALPLLVPNIAWQAHLGGMAGGALIGMVWSAQRRRSQAGLGLAASALVVGSLAVGAALFLDGGFLS
ncbi:MAG: rhomboid family intramembrane serine protease [Acidimicrobiia bacterium]|nr:rhomboid family intramembrane serine protease [bacterium]MYA38676.1 rhomboid family intramembrane serine protease [Acidimicrobiia bacterium]MYB79614.1 rhomboid family intramembrane serine protease [Acidimicrobiia bacterium]MYK56970.1 rhomboid family intramembrane serine protease [Acidimicrobiia bacterium]